MQPDAKAAEAQGDAPRPALVIGTSYDEPFSTDTGTGYFDRLLTRAGDRAGLAVTLLRLPAQRSLLDAQAGVIDGDVGRIRGLDARFDALVRVEHPVLANRAFVGFARETALVAGWPDVSELAVAHVTGWQVFEPLAGRAASSVTTATTEQAFRLLARDRTDVVLSAWTDGMLAAAQEGLRVRVLDPPVLTTAMYLYLHEAHADLAPVLADSLRAMDESGLMGQLWVEALSRAGLGFAP